MAIFNRNDTVIIDSNEYKIIHGNCTDCTNYSNGCCNGGKANITNLPKGYSTYKDCVELIGMYHCFAEIEQDEIW